MQFPGNKVDGEREEAYRRFEATVKDRGLSQLPARLERLISYRFFTTT